MRASKAVRTARARIVRIHSRLRRLTERTVKRIHDESLPFHFVANDNRIDADEMNRLTAIEERREEFMQDVHRSVLRSLKADPTWIKM
jgi:hypothetical protein